MSKNMYFNLAIKKMRPRYLRLHNYKKLIKRIKKLYK